MSNGEKSKMSLTAAGGFTLLGVGLTVAALFIPAVRLALVGSQTATKNWHATITLKNFTPTSPDTPNVGTGECDFKANHGGNDASNKFPSLSLGSRDDIDWTVKDGRPGQHDPQIFSVNFPSGGSPFSTNTFPTTNGHRVSSGPLLPTTTYGDFPYDSITLVTFDDNLNVKCSNAKDPGVHVDE